MNLEKNFGKHILLQICTHFYLEQNNIFKFHSINLLKFPYMGKDLLKEEADFGMEIAHLYSRLSARWRPWNSSLQSECCKTTRLSWEHRNQRSKS